MKRKLTKNFKDVQSEIDEILLHDKKHEYHRNQLTAEDVDVHAVRGSYLNKLEDWNVCDLYDDVLFEDNKVYKIWMIGGDFLLYVEPINKDTYNRQRNAIERIDETIQKLVETLSSVKKNLIVKHKTPNFLKQK